MKLDKNKFGVIGIDRIKFYVSVNAVNTLIEPDRYGIAPKGAKKYIYVDDMATGEKIKLTKLNYEKVMKHIELEVDNVVYGLSLTKERNKVVLDIVLPRLIYLEVHNAYNVIDKDEIIKGFEGLIEALLVEGIEIDPYEFWECFYIEINKTVITDESLSEYIKLLRWLLDNAMEREMINAKSEQQEQKVKWDYEKKIKDLVKSLTLHFGTKRIDKKLYDKMAQMFNVLGIVVEEEMNLSRLEIKLDKEAIRSAFGGVSVMDILNKDKMEKTYKRHTKILIEMLNLFTEETIQYLESQFESANYTGVKNVKDNKVADDVIFDILFLAEAMRRVYKKNNISKRFSTDVKKLSANHKHSLDGNYDKLSKLLIAFNDDIEVGRFDTVRKYF